MSKYFENAKVGDKVKCFLYGDGEIIAVREFKYLYPISVRFRTGLQLPYTADGTYFHETQTQTLFYADDCPQSIPYSKKKVIKVVKGWVNISNMGTFMFDDDEAYIKGTIQDGDKVKIAPATLTYEIEE